MADDLMQAGNRKQQKGTEHLAQSPGQQFFPSFEMPAGYPGGFGPDSPGATVFAETLDRVARATLARASLGISPVALWSAYLDWFLHLAISPGKQGKLAEKAATKLMRLARFSALCGLQGDHSCIEPLPQDRRFDHEGWKQFPFNLYAQNFLLTQQWWSNAMTGVRGVSAHHEKVVDFTTRQLLDVFSPSNYLLTNPEVLQKTQAEGGQNLVRGLQHFWEDVERQMRRLPPPGAEDYKVGETVGVTPGKVVFRNHLIELIQYEPQTPEVKAEPVLIVPAWIMKYYILDLSPQNSLVKYLVSKGFTVFMVSWRNPGPADRELGMEDYRKLGVDAALDAALAITGARKAHAAGYCLGGTLLSIAAAGMMHRGDDRLASLSLFAAQVDFTEAGELTLFIDESEVSFLEDMMWESGGLDTSQMAGAFQLLRSNDMIWSKGVREYLLGERAPMFDLMAWNADGTRMPYRMHSEYLTGLFLNNDFAEGRYKVDGTPVAVEDIKAPVFAVGTEQDHVAPWRSVFKICHLAEQDVTFVLTSGGHNAGIVSEPGHPHRHYRIRTSSAGDGYLDPKSWQAEAPVREGSWWEAWTAWLDSQSTATGPVPPIGNASKGYPVLGSAPGTYVLMP
ncbi:PHA/PHB synthase family protein [Roseibium suaedae]|uniref:Polyhydroxyalkanoate synthase n=2 Tax=Roseibium suaedae TaxID=735517 RepID=A0A1M7NAR5_9HYPH|nr:alpha/beta fold hydrolase [Roseibium suaedae]SHN00684.1 polyhydroxyalkanoate synthase [Roseibium suaedae]